MEFTKYAVAFIDILGFSSYVENSESDVDKRKNLSFLFHTLIPKQISLDGEFVTELKTISFSDSIIISAPCEVGSKQLGVIAVAIKSIQITHALLKLGFLVRGGIDVGNMYRNIESNIIVGTAYQKAITIEKSVDYPMIALSDTAKQTLEELVQKRMTSYAIFAKTSNGNVIVDTLFPHHSYIIGCDNANKNYIYERFLEYKSIIERNLEAITDKKAKRKWLWFAHFYNTHIEYFSEFYNYKNALLVKALKPEFTLNYLNPKPVKSDWLKKLPKKVVKINTSLINDNDNAS